MTMLRGILRSDCIGIVLTAAMCVLAANVLGQPRAVALDFDQNVTPDVIFGSGNDNGSFTVNRANRVELGLRGKLRHDASGQPQNTFNSNGDGTYSFDPVDPLGDSATAEWSFEWSINSDWDGTSGCKLDDLTYELRYDSDPSIDTSFTTFDPVNMNYADHAIGDNLTGNGGGLVATDDPAYASLIAQNNVAQNSWKPHWFLNPFDPTVEGVYDFVLNAYAGGTLVASTNMKIVVGDPVFVTDVDAIPNPVMIGNEYQLTATALAGAGVHSAEYTIDGGSTWTAMTASEGTFGDVLEPVDASVVAPTEAGIYDVCVRATDTNNIVSPEACTSLVVYDPSGGFVTGGGWLMSPPYAMAVPGPVTVWDQDFSVDASGWFDSDDGWYGDITASGGTAIVTDDGVGAPFSRFDGYRDFWPGTWAAEIDVYLDPAWTAGEGFDYSVAANGSDGSHQRDYIFHVGVVENYGPITGKALLVNGSNNADENFTTNPFKLLNDNGGNYYEVTSAGWYTLQHVFYDAGGYLAVDLNLVDDSGNVLWTATRENVADIIPDEVGGNRYSWFTHQEVAGGLMVDNHQLILVEQGPGPEGRANFGFVSKYKKGAQVPSGATEFVFKAGDLNFHSNIQEWLVVTGSNYAKFKGVGTINGEGNYKFMIWAGDGTGSGGEDTFRIKIWYEENGSEIVVYDNGMDQTIAKGNIIVHTK